MEKRIHNAATYTCTHHALPKFQIGGEKKSNCSYLYHSKFDYVSDLAGVDSNCWLFQTPFAIPQSNFFGL